MANSQAVTWGMTLRVDETIDVDVDKSPAGDQTLVTAFDLTNNPVIQHIFSGSSGALNSGTTPAATKTWSSRVALSGGSYTIDLTAMIGESGTKVDFSGLEIILVAVKPNGADSMTFADGASNGYPVYGDTNGQLTIPTGGADLFYTADGLGQVVDGTHKTIDVSGTTTQTFDILIVCG